jgi:hypothetical protein
MATLRRKSRRLLPLEEPGTNSIETARRWLTIYEQREALLGDELGARVSGEDAAAIGAGAAFWRRRILELVGLDLDPELRILRGAATDVHFTRREVELLQFLGQHMDRHFPDHVLATRAWGGMLSGDQVRIYVRRIRAKLAGTGWMITSRRGYGYTLEHVRGDGAGAQPGRSGPVPGESAAQTRARLEHAVGRAHALLANQRRMIEQTQEITTRLRASMQPRAR